MAGSGHSDHCPSMSSTTGPRMPRLSRWDFYHWLWIIWCSPVAHDFRGLWFKLHPFLKCLNWIFTKSFYSLHTEWPDGRIICSIFGYLHQSKFTLLHKRIAKEDFDFFQTLNKLCKFEHEENYVGYATLDPDIILHGLHFTEIYKLRCTSQRGASTFLMALAAHM